MTEENPSELNEHKELRKCPVLRYSDEAMCFYAATFKDVDHFLRSDRVTVDFPFRSSRQVFGPTILDSDEDNQILIKKDFMPFFTKKAVEHYRELFVRPRIKQILADGVLNNNGLIEFNYSVSQRIPTQIIMNIFGIDIKYERYLFKHLERLVLYLDHPTNSLSEALESKNELFDFLRMCFHGEISLDKHGLLHSIDRSIYVNEDEMLSSCLMVLTAGMATTIASLNSTLVYLYKHKDDLERLGNYAGVLRRFIEEVIRLEPAVRETVRFVKDDFEYKGTSLKKNDTLRLILASANRDEEKYADADNVDLSQRRENSFTFGKGKHTCIGADLAISELMIFVQEFLPIANSYRMYADDNDDIDEGKVIKMFKKIFLQRI